MGKIARKLGLESEDKTAFRCTAEKLNDDIRTLSAEVADAIVEDECLSERLDTLWWETYNTLEDEWIATKETARTPEEHKSVRRISNEKKRERITKERLLLNPVYQDTLCNQRRLRRQITEKRIKIDHKVRLLNILLR